MKKEKLNLKDKQPIWKERKKSSYFEHNMESMCEKHWKQFSICLCAND